MINFVSNFNELMFGAKKNMFSFYLLNLHYYVTCMNYNFMDI